MNEPAIRTQRLTHYFGTKAALSNVSLEVPQGAVFALVGRNGGGKTTFMRCVLGLLEPSRGQSWLLGRPSVALSAKLRAQVGYMAEGHPVLGRMQIAKYERFLSRLHRRWSSRLFRQVLEHFEVDPLMIAGNLSRGQRAILSLAATLAQEPDLLLLDDPTLGLDQVAQRTLLEAMLHFVEQRGHTIVIASHALRDVERLADWIAILDRGAIRACCPVETFRRRLREYTLSFPGEAPDALPSIPGLVESSRKEHEWRLVVANPDSSTSEALELTGATGIQDAGLSLEEGVTSYLARKQNRRFFLGEPT